MSRSRAAALAGIALLALILAWLLLPRPDLGPPPAAQLPKAKVGPAIPARMTVLPRPEPTPDGWRLIRCALRVPGEQATVPVLVFDGPDDVEGQPVSGDLSEDWLVFPAPATAGSALAALPGYEPTRVIWRADGSGGVVCDFPDELLAEEPGILRVPGFEEHSPGDFSYVIACAAMIRDPGTNGWVELERGPGPCLVQGCRATGTLNLCLEGERVEVKPGQTLTVDPPTPAEPLAGLGIGLRPDGAAIRITAVDPDGAAAAAGIASGDRILFIDGQSTEGMNLQSFRERGIAGAGTVARLVVEHEDGQTQTVEIERRPIGR